MVHLTLLHSRHFFRFTISFGRIGRRAESDEVQRVTDTKQTQQSASVNIGKDFATPPWRVHFRNETTQKVTFAFDFPYQ